MLFQIVVVLVNTEKRTLYQIINLNSMRRFFSTSFSEFYAILCLLLVRIGVGSFLMTHGIPKLSRLTSGEEIKFADPFGFGPVISLILVVFAEVIYSILIILGLGHTISVGTADYYHACGSISSTRQRSIQC